VVRAGTWHSQSMDLRALLDVQRLDTAMDQARHARANLPESAVQESAAGKLATLRARIGDLLREQGTLESELAGIEKHDAEIGTHLARLEKQLKSVIAPREAEALQHEMKNLMIEREAADERGLAIIEIRAADAEAARELAAAEATLRDAEKEADRAIAELSVARADLIASIDASDLATYERLRANHAGVAIAEIKHGVCGGCHMDISASELDAIKRLPADQFAECPNCTRLLLR
jgi:predicted  nucleic acid-binding Zn-ribbon protein